MQAALGQLGWVVNHKKIKRLMREHGLQPPQRRRFVVTTDSDHDQPIFPDRAEELVVDGRNQLWVADLTYVAIAVGCVYVAVIMDAWSRRIVGPKEAMRALERRIDARLTLARFMRAIWRSGSGVHEGGVRCAFSALDDGVGGGSGRFDYGHIARRIKAA